MHGYDIQYVFQQNVWKNMQKLTSDFMLHFFFP